MGPVDSLVIPFEYRPVDLYTRAWGRSIRVGRVLMKCPLLALSPEYMW